MNSRELQKLLDKEEFPFRIEVVRLSLAAMLSRVENEMELQEIDAVINNLWTFSTNELFGMSVKEIISRNYSPEDIGGVFHGIREYVDEWKDQIDRPKTYFMAYGVSWMLLTIVWNLSGHDYAGDHLVESVTTAAYALEEEDDQFYRWFLDVMLDNYRNLKQLQQLR